MRKTLFAMILLSSCSPTDEGQPGSGGNASSAAAPPAAKGDSPAPGRIATLAGLYEGGAGDPKHQMCIVGGKDGGDRFGLVVWGSNQHSCSGSGTVSRSGDRLRLTMAGDSACTIEATISGNTVKMPAETPSGCSYYCGASASLGGAELKQVGTSRDDAMKAKDIVGDPLCGEL